MGSAAEGAPLVSFGDLSVDYLGRMAYLRGKPLDLTRIQFDILAYLTTAAGQVVTREDLLLHVWGYKSFQDRNNISVHMHRLRQALEDTDKDPRFIQTHRGVGYKFLVRPDTASTMDTVYPARDTAFDHLDRKAQGDTVITLLDSDGVVDWVSSSIVNALGWPPHALIGMPVRSLAHREDIPRLSTAEGITRNVGGAPVRWRTADGGYRPLTVQRRPIPDVTGTVIGALDTWNPVVETVPQFLDGQILRSKTTA